MTLLTTARALLRHTPTHNPHPLHFWGSITGISINGFGLHFSLF
jgi:hypothetical protein